MKTAILSFAIFVAILENTLAFNDKQKTQIQQKFVEVGTECIKEHPLTVDDLISLKNRVFPDSDKAGCFTACVFKNIGLFNDKGHLDHLAALEHAKTLFEEEAELKQIEEFLTACVKVNDEEVHSSEEGCDRAKLAFQCFVDNHHKLGFNIEF